ncbi:MAG: LssY C-terminal domain-containing protein [Propionivibrio sp.]
MIESFYRAILPTLEHFHLLGYWIAFFSALLETALVVGLLLPGSTLLLLLGAWSASGHLDFGDLLWFSVAGAVLGDNFNYWLGQRYGNRWTQDGLWFLTADHFAQARRFFDRHGAKSVFLGRFIPSVKEIAPFVAGTVGMRRTTFMLWNVLGGIGWGLQWVGGGYLFGQSLKLAQTWMSRAGLAVIVALLAWAALWLLQRFVVRMGRELWRLTQSLARSCKAALGRNRTVGQLLQRHPDFFHFLAARVERSHFYGLPLSLLVLAFVYVLALFAGIVEDVVTADAIVALDHATAQLVAAFRAPAVLMPFVWITSLGETAAVTALLVVGCLLLWLTRRSTLIAGLLVASLGATTFSTLGKLAFQRPRPLGAVLLESSYSFPSGHATIAVAFYGFIGYLLIRFAATWTVRVRLFFATGSLVLLIGLSRIVLGVHYLSDVWGGYLVGALWLIVGISLTEWLHASGRINWHADWHARADRHRRALALGLIAIATAGFIGYAATRTLPALVRSPETVVQVDRPLAELLRAHDQASTATVFGDPAQPLSFAIVAPDAGALSARLIRAGWLAADRPNARNLLRLARQGLNYATAPLAPAFWNDRINDLAFERPLPGAQGKTVATLRVWRSGYRIGPDAVFVGVAREYDGIEWGILHTISPDVDAAAGRFVASLEQSGQSLAACQRALIPPMTGSYLMGEQFFTVGQLWLFGPADGNQGASLCEPLKPKQ